MIEAFLKASGGSKSPPTNASNEPFLDVSIEIEFVSSSIARQSTEVWMVSKCIMVINVHNLNRIEIPIQNTNYKIQTNCVLYIISAVKNLPLEVSHHSQK